jgi:2-polyprenyl-6-methoxyphenol hydroxylase-like FAD-dependent oxidoreductase
MDREVEVLVVGAGPVGLTAASALAKQGREVMIVDAAHEGANTSRAAVIHAKTLEVLESIEVTPRLLAEGVVVPVFTMRDRARVLAALDFSGLDTAYPFTLMVPQWRTERLLTERLTELGGRVLRGQRLTSVHSDGTGATATLEDDDGRDQRVQARYVIGADGMHSTVRDSIRIAFEGGSYEQSFVLADVVMDWPLPDHEVQLFFSPAGLVVVAPLPGGHHRIVATVDRAPENPTMHDVMSLLSERGPGEGVVRDLIWSSRFRLHHRVAQQYRRDSVFLAGDAAHVHSPAGGQGMNTGIQDAVDLASTLTAALQGKADEAALDGYEQRRRPIARQVVALTDRVTRLATARNGVLRGIRNLAISRALKVPRLQHSVTMQIAELTG